MSPATKISPVSTKPAASANINREETPFEALASICSVLVVGLFILTFLAQNYVIPSGSMENTLLVGDHLVVDQITLMPPASWMPLIRYREPRRGDIVVFIKPVYQCPDRRQPGTNSPLPSLTRGERQRPWRQDLGP